MKSHELDMPLIPSSMNHLTRLTYKRFEFEVDVQTNKSIYDLLTSDAEMQKNNEVVDFYLSNRHTFYSSELIEFCDSAGIDLTKENEIVHYSIDAGQLIIDGWYDVVGRFSSEKTLHFWWGNEFYSTNIYFRMDARHAVCKEFENLNTFRVEFAIVVEPEFPGLNKKDRETS
jgi:hypothetical protein